METFDYPLTAERIAQEPVEPRSSARLLVATDAAGRVVHRTVADLPGPRSAPVTCSVVNETRVLPARLALRKADGRAGRGARARPRRGDGSGQALVRPAAGCRRARCCGRRRRRSSRSGATPATANGRSGCSRRSSEHGAVPLPPYIDAPLADPERYQTVYARPRRLGRGADRRAAPHRTRCSTGAGTRAPRWRPSTWRSGWPPSGRSPSTRRGSRHARRALRRAAGDDGRVPAPSGSSPSAPRRCGRSSRRPRGESTGRTDLFIRAPFEFQVVDVLLTNFHMPRSSLLVLLDAFCRAALARPLRQSRWPRATGSCPSATPCSSRRRVTLAARARRAPTARRRATTVTTARGTFRRRASCRSGTRGAVQARWPPPISRTSAPRWCWPTPTT